MSRKYIYSFLIMLVLLFYCDVMRAYAVGANITKVIDYPSCTAAEQSFLNDYYNAVENGTYSAFAMQNSSTGAEKLTLFIFDSAGHTTIYPDSSSPYDITFNNTELKNFRSMTFTFNGTAYIGNAENNNSIRSGVKVGSFTSYVPYLSSGVSLDPVSAGTSYSNLVDYNISALMLRNLDTGNHQYISSLASYTPPTSSSSSSSSTSSSAEPSSSSSNSEPTPTPPFDSGGFLSDIGNKLVDLKDGIINGVKGLFVPGNENIVQDTFADVQAAFENKLSNGALSAKNLEDEINNLNKDSYNEEIIIEIPENTFFDGSVGIRGNLAEYIKPVASFLKPILTGLICILTFFLCRSKILLLLKGE
jgi:hypothetical protein